MAQSLWIFGSAIFALLGLAHLRITFFGKKLFPKDEAVENAMKSTHPRITRDTTMWKTWIGFNASHSAGAIFFGVINIWFAANHFSIIIDSTAFILMNITFVVFFLYLGKAYWFKIPFIGILLSLLSFIASWIMMFLS